MTADVPNPFNESDDAARARRRRSLVLAIGLVIFVVIVFIVTLAKLGGHVADRPL
jgi:t-SNARE complex subunit (syntaxin)